MRPFSQLMDVAHDIKGMGASYGYPLATEIAASLCRLIETSAGKAAARAEPRLASAHVDSLRAIVRDQIKSAEHPTGRAVLKMLAAEVEKARRRAALSALRITPFSPCLSA
ncbi:MAG: hypothetical protein NVV62_02815 [Terricaulis sp.]|nr:hypothetical protein [Terricaulis sp.]